MWKILYFLAAVGVFLPTTDGQQWDIRKMQECPCANDVIEAFLASVAKNEAESFNGQKLRLTLWQSTNDKCTAQVLDKSPKPGEIEISMVYHASVHMEEQDEAEVQQQGLVDMGQEQAGGDVGQGQADEDIGPQQEVDVGQGQADEDIGPQQEVDVGQGQADEELLDNLVMEQITESLATGQLQPKPDLGQEQEVADGAQQQANQSNDSHLETGGDKKDYKAQFSFSLDVNTGKLSDSTDSTRRTQRRRREIMPFDTVRIKMEINFEEPTSDDGTENNRIRPLLRKGLADYWLEMTNCLLDVKE